MMLAHCESSAKIAKMNASVAVKVDAAQQMLNGRRSSARIEAAYPARLRGVDIEDRPFKEEMVLQNLSGGGVYLHLKRQVREGAPVFLEVRLWSLQMSAFLPCVLLHAERFCASILSLTVATV
jgi:hypothetical protein